MIKRKITSVPLQRAAGSNKLVPETPQQGESNRSKFVRLANGRVNAALHSIRLIGNLANRSLYDYNEQDVERIKDILTRAQIIVFDKFEQRDRNEWVFDVESDDVVPVSEDAE